MAAMEKSPTVIRGSEESYRSSSIEQPTGTTSPRAEDKPAVSSGSNFRAEDFGSGTKLLSRGEAGDSDSRLSSVGAGDSVTSEHTSSDGSAPGGDVRDSESRLASVGAGDSVASEHTSSDGSAPGGEVRDSESRLASVGAGDSVASEHTSSDGSAPGLSCVQYDAECSECRITRRDPSPAELTMYLHALSYKVRCPSHSSPFPLFHSLVYRCLPCCWRCFCLFVCLFVCCCCFLSWHWHLPEEIPCLICFFLFLFSSLLFFWILLSWHWPPPLWDGMLSGSPLCFVVFLFRRCCCF